MRIKSVLPLLLLLLLLMLPASLHAQEVLLPLQYNPEKSAEALNTHLTTTKDTDLPLTLPFWDDFTYEGPYPDNNLWADNDVFINSGYAVHPKTYNAATFDLLDEQGNIYEDAEQNNILFRADNLTSHPIQLDELTPADSVVLSFYYQPQGQGGDPLENDKLILEFYLPADNNGENKTHGTSTRDDNEMNNDKESDNWQEVWHAEGEKLEAFSRDTFPYFKRVTIPIVDEDYFREDFRFRFRNEAAIPSGEQWNLSGTRSIWNLDYVYMDHGRSVFDSTYYDVAFASPAQSILRNMTAMPWSQYIANPEKVLRNNFTNNITNLDNNTYNYTYKYVIQDEDGNTLKTNSGGSFVISPFAEDGYQDYAPHSEPIVLNNPLPTAPATMREFHIVHILREGATGDKYPRNDTIAYRQRFSNYFAYDDGKPELIQVVKGFEPKRAVQFFAEHPDTLEAVQVFLAETLNDQAGEAMFDLIVWNSLDPEEELYRSGEPLSMSDFERNRFVSIEPDQPVLVEDTFYVGLQQNANPVTINKAIAIGYDMTNNMNERVLFDAGGGEGWLYSTESGVPMIRPVMKRDQITGTHTPVAEELAMTLYPNPVNGQQLHIRLDDPDIPTANADIQIIDARGRLVISGAFSSTVDVSSLPNGIYFLRLVSPQNKKISSSRFVVVR